jgi:hypothetical protein
MGLADFKYLNTIFLFGFARNFTLESLLEVVKEAGVVLVQEVLGGNTVDVEDLGKLLLENLVRFDMVTTFH